MSVTELRNDLLLAAASLIKPPREDEDRRRVKIKEKKIKNRVSLAACCRGAINSLSLGAAEEAPSLWISERITPPLLRAVLRTTSEILARALTTTKLLSFFRGAPLPREN